MKSVPVLITWDIDPAEPERIRLGVDRALSLLDELKIPSTFFFTAAYAERDVVLKVRSMGHQVGLHGMAHDDEEELSRLPLERQREILGRAHLLLGEIAGEVTAFRGPRVKISADTLEVLGELGYRTDSTVCSQRLDFLSSNLVNFGWLGAPRKAYHPGRSPFRRGHRRILEIPISAFVAPFISTTMRIFGLFFMKAFFWLLYAEGLVTGKPIVYLIHPVEFVERKEEFSLADLVPSRRWLIHGVPLRFAIAGRMGLKFFEKNRKLFAFLKRRRRAAFMTMEQCAGHLDKGAG